ncbi:MAG TPA: MFS transporter [Actinomycetes bacterium]|jgi:EmrB/QacA subfamily drug resistance transporter|nr:MFS transporter [Actinomycetes bacterium]
MWHDTLPRAAPAAGAGAADATPPSKHLTLLLLALTGLMLILDLTITNVALPTIQQALRMTPEGLQWVVNAYALGYGGLLLLGGRLADRLGRRRVFLAGVAIFTLASLLGGLASSGGMLVAARGLQGLGAALTGPAGLSILTTTFAEGPERNRALGVWSAVLASGGALGMLAGGLLTQYASWRWVLFVNVPVGALVLAATPRLVPATPGQLRAHIDAAGAVTVTAGLAALVYATTQIPQHGWAGGRTIGLLLLSAVLLGAFLAIQARRRAPLVPLRIFRHRSLAGADTVALLGGAAIIASPIFFLTLYLQQILGFSAIQAGLATLPLALAVIAASQLTPKLVNAVGPRWLLAGGLALAAVGLLLLGRIHPAGGYPTDVLGPIVLLGLGMGLTFVPLTASATAGVPPAEQGLASGLLQTAQQLGVALGLAALTSIATATTQGLLGPGHAGGPADPAALQAALTSGYAAALRVAALLALAAAALTTLILPPRRPARFQHLSHQPEEGS